MGIFDSLGKKAPSQAPQQRIQNQQPQLNEYAQKVAQNPQAYVPEIKRDPAAFVRQCGIEIPDGMTDPMQIFNYVIRSGQRPNPFMRGRR